MENARFLEDVQFGGGNKARNVVFEEESISLLILLLTIINLLTLFKTQSKITTMTCVQNSLLKI